MGVFVFAAGIAVFSVKIWRTVNRRKKAKHALLQEGFIPGYIPLNGDWIRFFELSFERNEEFSSRDIQSSPPYSLPKEKKTEDAFFHARMIHLAHAVRHSDEFRFWEADYTEASLPDLEKRLMEYQNKPAPLPPSSEKKHQTISLLHDIAVYVIKTATGSFPSAGGSENASWQTVFQIMRRLLHESTENADRQIFLQIYYQLRE